MHTTTTPTPPAPGGVFHSPALARASARFKALPNQTDNVLDGDIKISLLDHARLREIEAEI